MRPTSRWCSASMCSPTTGRSTTTRRCARSCPGPGAPRGDTEVLLHLLARYGKSCLAKTVGMFAFASWDARARRLLLARDRLGIKPLYYRLLPDGIAFASELKALMVLGKPQVDAGALRDFLFHGYVPAPKTIFRGISQAPGRPHADLGERARRDRALLGALGRGGARSRGGDRRACSMSSCARSCRRTCSRMFRSACS